jgi:hypothetical protein
MTKEQLDKLEKGKELLSSISYLDNMMDIEDSMTNRSGYVTIPKRFVTKELLNLIQKNILSIREQYQKEFDEL